MAWDCSKKIGMLGARSFALKRYSLASKGTTSLQLSTRMIRAFSDTQQTDHVEQALGPTVKDLNVAASYIEGNIK